MSIPVLRDECGLPVKASSVSVITRDDSGLPIRSLQRTFTAPGRKGSAPSAGMKVTGQVSPPLTSHVVTVRDESGFPVKVALGAIELPGIASREIGAEPAPRPSYRSETANSIVAMLRARQQYSTVEGIGADNIPNEALETPTPAQAPCPVREHSTRRERSSDLSGIITRLDAHMAEHGHGYSIVCCDEDDEYAVAKFFSRNQVYGFPNSNGTISSNYCRFVSQQHPLISICLVHPKHPFSRKSRIIVFLCVLSFAFFVEIALLDNFYYSQLEVCDDGCNNVDGECVGGENDGMSKGQYDKHCQYYRPWVLALICGTIIVPYNTLLVYLSSCSCLHGKSVFHINLIGRSFKQCLEYFGGKILIFVIACSVGMVIWGLYRCHDANDNYNIIATLIQAKCWSFVEWFAWTAPYFSFRYPIDRKRFYASVNKRNRNQRNFLNGEKFSNIDREASNQSLVS